MSVEQALLSFTLAAGLLTVTPGLDTALVLRTAAVEGGKQAMLTGIGICSGCLLWARCGFFRAQRTARRFRVRLQCATDRWRDLSGLFGNQIVYSRILFHFFKRHSGTSLEGSQSPRRFSLVEAWFVDEPSQSQGWRVLLELPATIYSGGGSCLVVQHFAGLDSCDRRVPLVSAVNKRD
jgi:hypothetical protein